MNTILVVLLTLGAGSVGTVLRFVAVRNWPVFGIHAVNVAGTVLLAGVVARLNAGAIGWQSAVIVGVGFSGALTTFASWIALIDERRQSSLTRTVLVDVAAPVLLAVALTVVTFIVSG